MRQVVPEAKRPAAASMDRGHIEVNTDIDIVPGCMYLVEKIPKKRIAKLLDNKRRFIDYILKRYRKLDPGKEYDSVVEAIIRPSLYFLVESSQTDIRTLSRAAEKRILAEIADHFARDPPPDRVKKWMYTAGVLKPPVPSKTSLSGRTLSQSAERAKLQTEVAEGLHNFANKLDTFYKTIGSHLSEHSGKFQALIRHLKLATTSLAARISLSDDPDKLRYFVILGDLLWEYGDRASVHSTDASIVALRRAISLAHRWGDRDQQVASLYLAVARRLEHRYDLSKNNADMDIVIAGYRDVLLRAEHLPDSDIFYAITYSRRLLYDRFSLLGNFSDLEDAISTQGLIDTLEPLDARSWCESHLTLGELLIARFHIQGRLDDLGMAIKAQRIARDSLGHWDNEIQLKCDNDLISSLTLRFQKLNMLTDLDEIIELNQHAADHWYSRRTTKRGTLSGFEFNKHLHYLYNLGTSLTLRFERFNEVRDLEKAIEVFIRFIEKKDAPPNLRLRVAKTCARLCWKSLNMSQAEPTQLFRVYDLALALIPQVASLELQFDRRHQELADLGEITSGATALAIQSKQYTLAVEWFEEGRGVVWAQLLHLRTPTSIGGLEIRHPNLAKKFQRLSSALRNSSAEEDVIEMEVDLNTISSRISLRDSSAGSHTDVRFDQRNNHPKRHYANSESEDESEFSEASPAPPIRVLSPHSPSASYHTFDSGDVGRTEIISPPYHHHDTGLESAITPNKPQPIGQAPMESTPAASTTSAFRLPASELRLKALMADYTSIIAEIRSKHGFENFLLPQKITELIPQDLDGPVVIINVHESHCDALAVFSVNQIIPIPLPELAPSRAEELRTEIADSLNKAGEGRQRGAVWSGRGSTNDEGISLALELLWNLVVYPILEAIEPILSRNRRAQDELPHITWCAGGPLALLPLHAAGIYGRRKAVAQLPSRAFERVISSYTPTLNLLARKRPDISPESGIPKILAIAQPSTPGFNALPGTIKEMEAIACHFPAKSFVRLDGAAATIDVVLAAMDINRPNIIHLACHGVQDRAQPTQSAFLLHDGPLSLETLTARTADGATLAFLSACQTAAGDENLPEEAVHLAAGMIVLGFRSVIGTMWSIDDRVAPYVAYKFYERLVATRGRDEAWNVAEALHHAVGCLRRRIGEHELLKWIPFVHLGL